VDTYSWFETDYLQTVGGEKNPVLKDGTTIKYKGGTAKCILFHSPDSMVNLDLALSKDAPVLAYGYTEIEAPEEGIKILALGSNDGCRLWLNGEQIWDVPTERGLFADDDLIPVMLKKGKNTILIKVEERGNSWGFCMRFLPFSITDFSKNGKLFSVIPKADRTVQLKSSFTEPVLSRLIKECEIEVVSDQNEPIIKEIRKQDFTRSLLLNTVDYKGTR
jgi:hypothetical protein